MEIKIRLDQAVLFSFLASLITSIICIFPKSVFAADPYVYWPLESNSSIVDSMGVMSNGTTTGTITTVTGHTDNALTFSSGSRATVSDSSKLLNFSGNDKQFSVSAWIKKDNFAGGGFGRVVGKMNQDNSENIWAMGITHEGGLYCAIFSNNNQQTSLITTDLNPKVYLNNGEWNYIGCVFNIQERKIIGFVNNTNVGSGVINEANSTLAESDQPVVINSKSTGSDSFNGTIDDVKIYNSLAWFGNTDTTPPTISFSNPTAESYVQLANLRPFVEMVSSKQPSVRVGINNSDSSGVYSVEYRNNEGAWTSIPNIISIGYANIPINPGTNVLEFRATDDYFVSRNTTAADDYLSYTVTAADPANNLMAYWNFESNTKLYDSVGYISDTVFSGGTPAVVEGHSGNALSFTNGSYVSLKDYPYIPDTSDTNGNSFFSSRFRSISAEAWVKSADFTAAGSYQNLVSSINYNQQLNWEMGVDNLGGLFCMFNDKNANSKSISTSSLSTPIYLANNQWNHVACVWDRRTGILKAYINHQLVSQTDYYLGYHDVYVSTEGTLNIAAQSDGSSHFNGQIDEVKVYNGAYDFTTSPATQVFLTVGTQTKTYCNSPAAVIPESSATTGAVDTIDVPDDFTYDSLSYSLNITHANSWDLTAKVTHDVSGGTSAYLFDTDNSPMYFNYKNGVGATFDELSANNMYYGTDSGSVPQNTGTFFPHEYYTLLSSEHSSKGPWTIDVWDPYEEAAGTLDSWCITFRYTPRASSSSSDSGSTSSSTPSVPECHATKPATPTITGHKVLSNNSVILEFNGPSENLTRYDLLFGTSKDNLRYGAIDIARKNDRKLLVNHLRPNTKYYFRLVAVNDCLPGEYSSIYEVSLGTPSTPNLFGSSLPVFDQIVSQENNNVSDSAPFLNTTVTQAITPTSTPTAIPQRKTDTVAPAPKANILNNLFQKIISFFGHLFGK